MKHKAIESRNTRRQGSAVTTPQVGEVIHSTRTCRENRSPIRQHRARTAEDHLCGREPGTPSSLGGCVLILNAPSAHCQPTRQGPHRSIATGTTSAVIGANPQCGSCSDFTAERDSTWLWKALIPQVQCPPERLRTYRPKARRKTEASSAAEELAQRQSPRRGIDSRAERNRLTIELRRMSRVTR